MIKKLNKSKKLLGILCAISLIGCMFVIGVSATDTAVTEPNLVTSATTVFDAVHTQVNFTNILGVLGVALGACASLYMLWWAARKVVSLIKKGSKGKLSV